MNNEQEFESIKKNLKKYSYTLTFAFMGVAALILLGFFGKLGPNGYRILSIGLAIAFIYLFTLKRKVTIQVNTYIGNFDHQYGKPNDVLKFSLDVIFKEGTNYKNFTQKVIASKKEK